MLKHIIKFECFKLILMVLLNIYGGFILWNIIIHIYLAIHVRTENKTRKNYLDNNGINTSHSKPTVVTNDNCVQKNYMFSSLMETVIYKPRISYTLSAAKHGTGFVRIFLGCTKTKILDKDHTCRIITWFLIIVVNHVIAIGSLHPCQCVICIATEVFTRYICCWYVVDGNCWGQLKNPLYLLIFHT